MSAIDPQLRPFCNIDFMVNVFIANRCREFEIFHTIYSFPKCESI